MAEDGSAAVAGGTSMNPATGTAGGAGGSSWIDGVNNGATIGGNGSMPNPQGGEMTGRTGNGHARITTMESSEPPFEEFEREFEFTGGIQEVTVGPGTYHLEVWGAQGGGNAAQEVILGRGGFSEGIITLTTETTLYVAVGGRGLRNTNGGAGGFNGGGATTSRTQGAGSGGGATHVSRASGLLNNEVVRNNILIVAGGGGGRGGSGASTGGDGGSGGGLTGGAGTQFITDANRRGGSRS